MSLHHIVFVLFRVIAVYFFAEGVQSLSQLISFGDDSLRELFQDTLWIAMVGAVVPMAVYFIFSILMWFGAGYLARRLAGNSGEAVEWKDPNFKGLYVLSFTVLGLFFAIRSIPSVVQGLAFAIHYREQGADSVLLAFTQWPGLIGSAVVMLLGIALFVGAEFWVRLLMKIRGLGQ